MIGLFVLHVFETPKWWNWHTRTTQNRMGFAREGSTPSFGTIKKLTPVELGFCLFSEEIDHQLPITHNMVNNMTCLSLAEI